jgi:hypothetical protein
MPRVRELLDRFRPAGAPGAPSAAGVPADRRRDVIAELEPVFARLVDVERECDALREQAEQDAAAIRQRGADDARAVLAAAETRSAAERAAAGVEVQHNAEAESAMRLAAAERAAQEIGDRAIPLMPAYVDRVLAAVAGLLGAEQPPPVESTRP